MKLSEVFKVNVDKDVKIYDTSRHPTYGFNEDSAELLAKAGDMSLYLSPPAAYTKEMREIYLVNADKNILGTIDLDKIKRNAYRVATVQITPRYQGFDLALWAYTKFIQAGYVLVSGGMQSEGGLSIWKKLAEQPNIVVYVYDKATGTYEDLIDGEEVEDEAVEHELDDMGFVDGSYEFPGLPEKLLIAMKR